VVPSSVSDWEGPARSVSYGRGSAELTCPRVSFKTQSQLFTESGTRAPGDGYGQDVGGSLTLLEARSYLVTENGVQFG
jgi:hypothetical protein